MNLAPQLAHKIININSPVGKYSLLRAHVDSIHHSYHYAFAFCRYGRHEQWKHCLFVLVFWPGHSEREKPIVVNVKMNEHRCSLLLMLKNSAWQHRMLSLFPLWFCFCGIFSEVEKKQQILFMASFESFFLTLDFI